MPPLKLTKTYEKYPGYKEAIDQWLGKIPNEWRTIPIQRVFRRIKRIGYEREELLSVYRDRGIIIKSSRDDNFNKPSLDLKPYQLVEKGDLVINKMKAWQGSLGISAYRGIVSPAYFTYRSTSKNNSKYFHYLLRSNIYIKQYESISGGIRNNQWDLDPDKFKKISILVPTFDEQRNIADFLESKMVFIDQIIEKKQKLIELLSEKRSAIINEQMLSAKGEKGKIKFFVSVNPSKKSIPETNLSDKVTFVPMEAISDKGELNLQEKTYQDVKEGFTYFQENDVVLAKITPCYENGKAGVMTGLKNGFGFGTTEFLVLRSLGKVLPKYLYYTIYSDKFRKMGEVEMRGTAGQKRVSNSFVKNFELSLPDIVTQQKLVENLDNKLKLVDFASATIGKSIKSLHEFRSSLIYHAVTGKIKI